MPYTLTTPLYYVNDQPHLGSVYTTLACDALARFQRLDQLEVVFITGVDEHGQKIQRMADQKGMSPQSYCDTISQRYRDLWSRWSISQDRFVRTTNPHHSELVEQFFDRVQASGDIISGRQIGWYCVGCEEYKDNTDHAVAPSCPIHQKALEWRDEENLFFRLSRYQNEIEQLVAQDDFITPANRRQEVRNFVARGLRDFSISRVNLSWGLPVPGHPGHVFYVWFDALLGYLTALLDDGGSINLNRLKECGWPASIHIIGKDIIRFHAIFWPAMLLSAGLPIPQRIFGHGFLTREGQKMGKSLGNILDPGLLLNQYGADAVRWYLLRDIQFGDDGDFQQQRFTCLVNNDLANTIGNLLNRTSSMARKWFNDSVPPNGIGIQVDHDLAVKAQTAIDTVFRSLPELEFKSAAEAILRLAIAANSHLNNTAPWNRIKQPNQIDGVAEDLYVVLESTRIVGLLLAPLVPDLSERILNQLACKLDSKNWKDQLRWGGLITGTKLPKPVPVMQRLEIMKDH
ncbi:methionine--tRNA ligase [Synechococcus sp. M16CYN]|uniref:methionine--tRNA ligase n=1 Tax=Synechococcus sp. M16CYN TaxID=3103139 RepID=UPI0033400A9A